MDTNPVQTKTITATLTQATGFGGAFTIPYPDNAGATDFAGGRAILRSNGHNEIHESRSQFSVAYTGAGAEITILTAMSYAEGDRVWLDVDVGARGKGSDKIAAAELADESTMQLRQPVAINLGAPATADADGAVVSQAATAADGLATGINGALASGGIASFDVPRNVVAGWTGTAVLTVTGTDAYGNVIVESSGSGTSLTGKKAFKTVTGISVSANVTGLTVGSGTVLGLPCYLADQADLIVEKQDGAAATAGTVLAGVTGAQTATTGDVRGTYGPNSAPNGSRVFELVALVRDPSYTGADQFAG